MNFSKIVLALALLFNISCTVEGIAPGSTRSDQIEESFTITIPSQSPHYSNSNILVIAGACTDGLRIQIRNEASNQTVCQNSEFSLSVLRSNENAHLIEIVAFRDENEVSVRQLIWNLDLTPPSAPNILSPNTNPFTSNQSNLSLVVQCDPETSVHLSGAQSLTQLCENGSSTFALVQNNDGTYNYNIGQTDLAGNASLPTSFQWIRSTSTPSIPSISSPTSNPFYSNSSNMTLAGSCITGGQVFVTGASTQTFDCIAGNYSFSFTENTDGPYSYTIYQNDSSGNPSSSINFSWIRDTLAPLPPTRTSPATNPYLSGGSLLEIQGACEVNSIVHLSGDETQSTPCATGLYSFSVLRGTDSTYNFSIHQSDLAQNNSSNISLQWTRDTSTPSPPVITTPASSPFYSNLSQITLSGSCTSGFMIQLSGDVNSSEILTPLNSLQQTCLSGTFSFLIEKVLDGNFAFQVAQTNPINNNTSTTSLRTWIRDTSAPSPPLILSPSTSPFTSSNSSLTISGSCELSSTVFMTGDDNQSVACSAGNFNFVVNAAVDGTYNYSIYQSDLAGNNSLSASQVWTRSQATPPPPTISNPAISPFYSNLSSITLTGSCQDGLTVMLSGDLVPGEILIPLGQASQICTGSSFSYTIEKISDGSFLFNLLQSNGAQDSGSVSINWIRDTVAPNITISTGPSNPNLSVNAQLTFTANEPAQSFECSLDGAVFSPCSSPITYPVLQNGQRSFGVRAVDLANNLSSEANWNWNQEAGRTIALYHFDTPSGAEFDSSLYEGIYNNSLTLSGTTQGATAQINQSLNFNGTAFGTAPNNETHLLIRNTMSVESWLRLNSLPSNNSAMVIASKMGNAGLQSWEFGIRRQGGSYYMYFTGSLDGSNNTRVSSSAISINTASFNHMAVTWNQGAIQFFFNGNPSGSGSIGTIGSSSLFISSVNLSVGRNETTTPSYLNGILDELRVSQIVRWTSAFTPPSNNLSPD